MGLSVTHTAPRALRPPGAGGTRRSSRRDGFPPAAGLTSVLICREALRLGGAPSQHPPPVQNTPLSLARCGLGWLVAQPQTYPRTCLEIHPRDSGNPSGPYMVTSAHGAGVSGRGPRPEVTRGRQERHHLELSRGGEICQQLEVIREGQPCPAVNHQHGACHIGCQGAGQVQRTVGHLGLVAQPLQGDVQNLGADTDLAATCKDTRLSPMTEGTQGPPPPTLGLETASSWEPKEPVLLLGVSQPAGRGTRGGTVGCGVPRAYPAAGTPPCH